MTKVLIITNKSDLTSDFVIKKLKERRIDFYRFNTDELTKSVSLSLDLSNGKYQLFDSHSKEVKDLKDFTSIYFRRPEIPSIDNKNLNIGEIDFLKKEILFTLEGIYKLLQNAYWVSPLFSIREAENKIYQLELAKHLGFIIPETIISNSYDAVIAFYKRNNNDCIIKPIKSGLIETKSESKIIFTDTLSGIPENKYKIESIPCFLQNCIEKQGDVRVTVVGEKVFATLIHSQNDQEARIDWRRSEKTLTHSKLEIPLELKNKCISLLKVLNLRFGAIDFVLDKNEKYVFLEINPNGQWAWIEKQIGYEISNEIVNLLEYEYF
jgi:glutathione synthase/RimK-type ligase-like ATP-grasp enzyme